MRWRALIGALTLCLGIWGGTAKAFVIEPVKSTMHPIRESALFINRITSYLNFKTELGTMPGGTSEYIVVVALSPHIGMGGFGIYALQDIYGDINPADMHCSFRPDKE
ncbi:hypothetical protein MHY1_00109 [Methylovirgula sp. HY1]|nr:hypothetical protein MHY1_00109 [Methylovirgula sp. HY1]